MSKVDPSMLEMLDSFVLETSDMLEELDQILMEAEQEKDLTEDQIGRIFRITHTIKGSAAMMGQNKMSELSHTIEDVFSVLRETPDKLDAVADSLFDLVFQSSDFIKAELENVGDESCEEADPSALTKELRKLADQLSGKTAPSAGASDAGTQAAVDDGSAYRILVRFEDNCMMENVRACMLITQLQDCCSRVDSIPDHPELNPDCAEDIVRDGLQLYLLPEDSINDVTQVLETALSVKSYEVLSEPENMKQEKTVEKPETKSAPQPSQGTAKPVAKKEPAKKNSRNGGKQNLIPVNQEKLDILMDLVGEIVTAESMVEGDRDLKGLKLDHFSKTFRQLRKLTDELQSVVMSTRMVPLKGTFNKMNRIVRDMDKKLDKKAVLVTEGSETEIDKTVNDMIGDPLMHMVRNAMDHAIESPAERIAAGKPETGTIALRARDAGGEIVIEVADDGAGLDREVLLAKAQQRGLLVKAPEEYSDREVFGLIMLAGFSTNKDVTEYSGRGVGMDVVRKNVEAIGGNISISSQKGVGTTFTIKLPLTLAIVDGMNLKVGDTTFTVPISSICQNFRVSDETEVIKNTAGYELITLRNEYYPLVRMGEQFGIEQTCEKLEDGILILVESGDRRACLLVDQLLGEYRVVVKPFPSYFDEYNLKQSGLSGCSILGDGTISLILDVNHLLNEE